MKTKIMFLSMLAGLSLSSVAQDYQQWPVPAQLDNEMCYSPKSTHFSVWSPMAKSASVYIYKNDEAGCKPKVVKLRKMSDGTWQADVKGNWHGYYYDFRVMQQGDKEERLHSPGIFVKMVGTNGKRGYVADMSETNPEGWESDKRPPMKSFADMIVYELHHRDFSMDTESGMKNSGKFLALTEENTVTSDSLASGLSHLKELGVTHIQILPSYDYGSVDESKPDVPQYNWGYDPMNYNVPEGSYATTTADPTARVREFKQMVMACHKAGIRVILDVVYNHTYNTTDSPLELTAPGYFYRKNADGTWANGSGCGNETASERPAYRQFIIESVRHWAEEYHIDGFRFDLMGIHDIDTMNEVRKALDEIDPTIYVGGEGWAASSPLYDDAKLAMKSNAYLMPGISVFGDEMRDGLRGGWQNDAEGAFLVGEPGNEESVKFGIVGAIEHPQIDYSKVNYSKVPWALQPTQMISYVSCHDDMCIADRIKSTAPKASRDEQISLFCMAQTAVFTSQGIPFIFAGDEMMRNKKGVHNSFESPDSINTIPWHQKKEYKVAFDYVRGLVQLRKEHPAFRLGNADEVRKHLAFLPVGEKNVIAYKISGHAGGDSAEELIVILNSNKKTVELELDNKEYTILAMENRIDLSGKIGICLGGKVRVPAQTAMILKF